jgi:hypothetical protein
MTQEPEANEPPSSVEIVKRFLRAQNMEQTGRLDEAIALYEEAVAARFDSTGPYDRLIAIYSHRAQHKDVVRIAAAALDAVRTYTDKKEWYERMRTEAETASTKLQT